jgi:hypothetical protein
MAYAKLHFILLAYDVVYIDATGVYVGTSYITAVRTSFHPNCMFLSNSCIR